MTVEAQRPTGRPGTAPRGPAGPHPEPHGPKTPTRPAEPPPPSGPKQQAADILALIDENLIGALGLASLALPEPSDRLETCGAEILKFRLRRARAAVADLLQYSGRDGNFVANVASRPVQPPAGRPPLPGGDFLLPRDVRVPLAAALNRRAD